MNEKSELKKKTMTFDEVKEIVNWMKKSDVQSFVFEELTVNFSPMAFVGKAMKMESEILGEDGKKRLTPEEETEKLLYASS